MQHDHDVHAHQPVLRAGPAISDARLVAILLHGRGADAEDILGLSREFTASDVAYLAPQAADHTWYPYSFLAPMERNEPNLSSALRLISRLVQDLQQQNVSPERVVLLGFSQGACLTLEFAAQHARRYAAVVALSGGLIGPPTTPRDYSGSFDATPVFIGCSDIDAHVPVERVNESAEVFRRMGAVVDERVYRGMGHTVNEDEISAVDALLSSSG
ncbi:MAG TPA: alpha/beta fold hydrolase [Bryobacteraceae bacterium]|nr:alpha/beta fold hydrolase [Bryobacteraceae bacterium]